jgi:hypothetical protein
MKGAKEKKDLPIWVIVSAIGVVIAVVAGIFVKGSSAGELSRDDIAKIRGSQTQQATQSLGGAAPPMSTP